MGGDLNINFDDDRSEAKQILSNLFLSFDLEMYVNEPTRITAHSQTRIDYLCSNSALRQMFVSCSVIPVGLSDHEAILAKFQLSMDKPPKYKVGRLLSSKNYKRFKDICELLNWPAVLNCQSPLNEFQRLVTDAFFKSFPLQKIKQKKSKLWITPAIKVSSKNMRSLQNIRKFTECPQFIGYFCRYRSIYKKVLKAAKEKFYQNRIKSSKNASKENWNIINQLTGKNSVLQTDVKLDPNILNSFYCTVAETLQQNLKSNVDPCSFLLGVTINDTFVLETTNTFELIEVFKGIKNKKSSGYDDISIDLLKNLPDNALYVLCECFNVSFLTGIFPDCLKKAIVVPLHKGGELDNACNYRPISLLSTLSKIVEKLVKRRMLEYLSRHNIISDTQFGFQPSKGTHDAMFNLLEQVFFGLNEGELVAIVFCDFSKAFDCVDHKTMLKKLEIYGFGGITYSWFESYFSGREQRVKIGDNQSSYLAVSSGVPQGSVLGPILFLLYLNDINNLPIRAKLTSFADDNTLSWKGKNIEDLKRIISEDLNLVKSWCDSNLLCFNSKKTSILTFKFLFDDLILDTHAIENRTSCKFLGVHVDTQLKFSEHVASLNKRLASGCYAVRIASNELGLSTAKLVYFSLVESHIRYGIAFWGNCSNRLFDSVFVIQKRAIRYMCKVGYREHCKPLFLKHKVLTVCCIFIMETACLMHKKHYDELEYPRTYPTRQQLQIQLPIPKTALTLNSIIYRSKQIFNHLPVNLRQLGDSKRFRLELKTFLYGKAYYHINEFLNEKF